MKTLNYVEAPNDYTITDEVSIFIAGGISNCEEWQSNVLKDLERNRDIQKKNIVLFNPRRANFDINDIKQTEIQIEWEHKQLKRADIILFWFCKETLCPITLFEYGKYLVSNKRIFVGCHKLYQKRYDIICQTFLERKDVVVHDYLCDVILDLKFMCKDVWW